MNKTKKVQGLVIRKFDLISGDRFFTVLTSNGFRLDLVTKRIANSKKREITSTDILSFSEFIYYDKTKVVKESFLIDRYFIYDLKKLKISFFIATVLYKITDYESNFKKYFDAYIYILEYLRDNEYSDKLVDMFLKVVSKEEGLGLQEGDLEEFINKYLEINLRYNNFMAYATKK